MTNVAIINRQPKAQRAQAVVAVAPAFNNVMFKHDDRSSALLEIILKV